LGVPEVCKDLSFVEGETCGSIIYARVLCFGDEREPTGILVLVELEWAETGWLMVGPNCPP
jgi:hypothetical protein